jgi:hypothetical protein
MFRAAVLVLCATSTLALAAPVPRPSEKELLATHWGKTEGQGEFELNGKQLTIRTIGQPDNGLIGLLGNDRITMPRVSRTVSGDFELTVKVLDAALPGKDAKHTHTWPATRAGLFVEGDGYGLEFHLHQYFPKVNGETKAEPTRCIWVDSWFPRGGAGSSLKQAESGKSTYLRVTRKGKTVTVSYSFDGKDWSAPYSPRQELAFPDEVTVGVFFAHTTYQVLEATFDGLTVEKPKEK